MHVTGGHVCVGSEECEELETSMRRWGLDPKQDARHMEFWKSALTIVSDSVEGKGHIMMDSHPLNDVELDEVPQVDRGKAIDGFLDAIVRVAVDGGC